jgi:hypothetical protein
MSDLEEYKGLNCDCPDHPAISDLRGVETIPVNRSREVLFSFNNRPRPVLKPAIGSELIEELTFCIRK